MANRFKPDSKVRYGQDPLPTGYPTEATSDFVVPPVGLEDVDVGLFNLFDKELKPAVGGTDSSDLKKVPIVFAGGEKWAMIKNNRPLRDKTNSLILPLITISRTSFAQASSEDITNRGINQRTGEIIIRKKLDKSDRGYQNVINKIFLKHQNNLAVDASNADSGQLTTLQEVGELQEDPTVEDGGLLLSNRRNNIVETLVVPSPQFVTVNYDVIVWTQYTHHMNQIMEHIVSSFLPQLQGWRLDTPKGYWFIARVSEELFNYETNFEDMSQGERVIKSKFTVKVPAYIFASAAPGVPIPVKRYVSAPIISFKTEEQQLNSALGPTVEEPMLGTDDPTLPLDIHGRRRPDRRATGDERLYTSGAAINPQDPALLSIPRGRPLARYAQVTTRKLDGTLIKKNVRVASINIHTGETVYSPGTDLGLQSIVAVEE